MERNDISYLVMKACVIGALIIISCLSVSCGQTSLCQLSVFKNSSILSGRDTVEMFTLVNVCSSDELCRFADGRLCS